jgi:hypothetical protein
MRTARVAATLWLALAAPAAADTRLATDTNPAQLNGDAGVLAWIGGGPDDRIVRVHDGQRVREFLSIPTAATPDVGRDGTGDAVLVYSRCRRGRCGLEGVRVRDGRRVHLPRSAAKGCDVLNGSIWGRGLAFSRSGRRCRSRGLYLRLGNRAPRRIARSDGLTPDRVDFDGLHVAQLSLRVRSGVGGTDQDVVESELLVVGRSGREELPLRYGQASDENGTDGPRILGGALDAGRAYWAIEYADRERLEPDFALERSVVPERDFSEETRDPRFQIGFAVDGGVLTYLTADGVHRADAPVPVFSRR